MDFTLLRLLLALSVAVAHYRVLTGVAPAWSFGVSSTVAVQAFFVVSGWIVTASYETSRSSAGFFVRRMARLYPLYAVVVLAQAAVAVALAKAPAGMASGEVLHYLAVNLGFANFLKPTLLGFFDGARVAAINPSLWTMKTEVLFYLSVPLWVVLARRFGPWSLIGVFVASTAYVYATEPASAELAKQLPGQLRFFVAGMLGRLLLVGGLLPRHWNKGLLAAVGIAGVVLAQTFESTYAIGALQPLFVLAIVAAAGQLLPVIKGMPDISFGVYLMHAPLIQFTHTTGWIEPGSAGLIAILAATLALSTAACFLIEQPAVRAGRWLSRRIESSPANRPRAVAEGAP